MKIYHNIKPIYNKDAKVLILGSMPSVISREKKFYYANKNNRFWPILETLFKVKLSTSEDKKKFLLNNNIALWDVFQSVDISKSSDSSIKNVKYNDILKVLQETKVKVIFCTGKVSYNALIKHFTLDTLVIYLPSPSSANAKFSLVDLVKEYRTILDYL